MENFADVGENLFAIGKTYNLLGSPVEECEGCDQPIGGIASKPIANNTIPICDQRLMDNPWDQDQYYHPNDEVPQFQPKLHSVIYDYIYDKMGYPRSCVTHPNQFSH